MHHGESFFLLLGDCLSVVAAATAAVLVKCGDRDDAKWASDSAEFFFVSKVLVVGCESGACELLLDWNE